jgi:hypothetical protein
LNSWKSILTLAIAVLVTAAVATPAFAIFPQLQARLSGPAIAGVTPEGDAKLDQSRQPNEPGRLEVRVKNVNLADGTRLTVTLRGVPVGTITLSRREGQLRTNVAFQVGRSDLPDVKLGDAVILHGVWHS